MCTLYLKNDLLVCNSKMVKININKTAVKEYIETSTLNI